MVVDVVQRFDGVFDVGADEPSVTRRCSAGRCRRMGRRSGRGRSGGEVERWHTAPRVLVHL